VRVNDAQSSSSYYTQSKHAVRAYTLIQRAFRTFQVRFNFWEFY